MPRLGYSLYYMIGSGGDNSVVIEMVGRLVDLKTVLASFEIFRNRFGWLSETGV